MLYQKGQPVDGPQIRIHNVTHSLLELLLRTLALQNTRAKMVFTFEQLTQVFLKAENLELFGELFGAVLVQHPSVMAYKSIYEYTLYLKDNYTSVLEAHAVGLLRIMLPQSQVIFKQYLHQARAKPLLLTLTKIV